MTASATLARPAAEQPPRDQERWFQLSDVASVVEQLVLERESGLTAAIEAGFELADIAPAEPAMAAWDSWFVEATQGRALSVESRPRIDSRSEPLHIDEARFDLSRSYVGGAAMRLRRTRR